VVTNHLVPQVMQGDHVWFNTDNCIIIIGFHNALFHLYHDQDNLSLPPSSHLEKYEHTHILHHCHRMNHHHQYRCYHLLLGSILCIHHCSHITVSIESFPQSIVLSSMDSSLMLGPAVKGLNASSPLINKLEQSTATDATGCVCFGFLP
jgi:hypothetical protein